jgi:hypothetical protein
MKQKNQKQSAIPEMNVTTLQHGSGTVEKYILYLAA